MPDNPDIQLQNEDPWLTVPQVSEELKLHPATVRAWVKSAAASRPSAPAGPGGCVALRSIARSCQTPRRRTSAQELRSRRSARRTASPRRTAAPRQIADHIMTVGSGAR